MKDFTEALSGYRLTTAEILYHMPDHPHLLQSYLWQEFDLAPIYPKFNKFLKFWMTSIDGKIHSVKIAHGSNLKPNCIVAPGFSCAIN